MKDYSNYHNVSINDKIAHDGKLIFEYGLDGFEGYTVQMDGTDKKVLIYNSFSDKQGTTKHVIGQIADIERGKTLLVNDDYWIIISKPDDNKIYRKASIRLCNSKFPLPGGTEVKTKIGNDPRTGRPVYETVISPPTLLPCIVESTIYLPNDSQSIQLPNGKILVTIPYTVNDAIAENKEFEMYGEQYQIVGIDRSQSVEGVGLMILHCEREVSDE
ncbi:hypothetical protein P4V41_07170 [Fictibacillus nanhaiensis]|uniref:hypothetical protein n=1 Tax=Fictibacillus nanhaiensis TaxID=742169 RepID=UPI002E1E9B4C|nr:hypothetical protein [Fictibacillus nanhaiensis]